MLNSRALSTTGACAKEDLTFLKIHLQIAERKHGFYRRWRLRPPQHRLDSGSEFAGAEGLGNVIVGANLESDHLVDLVGSRSQEDDRYGFRVPIGLQLFANFLSGEPWQHHIQQNQIRPVSSCRQQARSPVAISLNRKAFLSQVVSHQVLNIRVVFNQEDFLHAASA